MTGGRVVVLGAAGRNFAAGMSGGIAYVLDEAGDFARRCNQDMVLLERLDPEEEWLVRGMVQRHARHTGSERARWLLADWPAQARHFAARRCRATTSVSCKRWSGRRWPVLAGRGRDVGLRGQQGRRGAG